MPDSIIPDCCERHRRLGLVDFASANIANAAANIADGTLANLSPTEMDAYCEELRRLTDILSLNFFLASRLRGCDEVGSVDGEFPAHWDDTVPADPGNDDSSVESG